MSYFLHSIRTVSYWKYALFSINSINLFFAVLGGAWLLLELADYFTIIERGTLGFTPLWIVLVVAFVTVLVTRRPIDKICYKVPGKDLLIEVRIGNLFDVPGQKVISTNSTFDTDIAKGIIAVDSLQGQFTSNYFAGDLQRLDAEIDVALAGESFTMLENPVGKSKKYNIGTVAKITLCNEHFYWVAMADLNQYGTAVSDLNLIKDALYHLWVFLINRGEFDTIVIPLLGTGRGRIRTNRKKLIEIIAQSFIDASEKFQLFSNKLVIVVHPENAKSFDINLFEVKDYLSHALEH